MNVLREVYVLSVKHNMSFPGRMPVDLTRVKARRLS